MRSDSARLTRVRILFTSWVTSTEWYTGSGMSSRRGAGPFRGIGLALPLGAVPRPSLLAVADTGRVEGAPDDLVADARKAADAATAHEHDGVLLQVVADARDVGRDLLAARQAHTGDLAQRRVRLLRRVRVHARADAAPLGRAPQSRGLGLGRLRLPALADQLGNGGHACSSETFRFFVYLPAYNAGRSAKKRVANQPAVSSGPARKLASSSPMPAATGSPSPSPVPMLASQAARS